MVIVSPGGSRGYYLSLVVVSLVVALMVVAAPAAGLGVEHVVGPGRVRN